MKKIIILILLVSCLMFCRIPEEIYTGKLIRVEHSLTGGFLTEERWTLTFEDGSIFTIRNQPKDGFKIGEIHTIYKARGRSSKVKRGEIAASQKLYYVN